MFLSTALLHLSLFPFSCVGKVRSKLTKLDVALLCLTWVFLLGNRTGGKVDPKIGVINRRKSMTLTISSTVDVNLVRNGRT